MIWLLLVAAVGAGGAYPPAGDCATCHASTTPGAIRHYETSAHRQAEVGCTDCHGSDHEANHATDGTRTPVLAEVCGSCHPAALAEHQRSKHSIGFRAAQLCTRNLPEDRRDESRCGECHESGSQLPKTAVECARFQAQSPAVQRRGCLTCHQVEARCDTCHTPHDTDLEVARDPGVCATCHMGPDHPQHEAWDTSRHGQLFALKGRDYAPDCVSCHLVGGSHDVSSGIARGQSDEARATEREKMIELCSQCHGASFSRRSLDDADTINAEAQAIVAEARALVMDLDRRGLLEPSPAERPAHPLVGHRLELGAQMLYEDLSRVEAELFRMKKFHAITAAVGAYHQNPDYTHWYGIAPLKLELSKIRSDAALLDQIARLKRRIEVIEAEGRSAPVGGTETALERELLELRDRFLRGEIDAGERDRIKGELLDQAGF